MTTEKGKSKTNYKTTDRDAQQREPTTFDTLHNYQHASYQSYYGSHLHN